MTSVGDKADIEALLERIGETGELPEPYAADPGSLFLAIHRQWVENGGTVAGKRRHSIRTLEELLRAEGTPVPSLRSKLNGETRLRRDDVEALLDVYFLRWRFDSNRGRNDGGYRSLETVNFRQAQRTILSALFGSRNAVLLPKTGEDRRAGARNVKVRSDESAVFLDGQDLHSDIFKNCRVFIHISRIGTVVGPTTASAIRRFCEIIDGYWKIDQEDKLDRILIWIVDPGDRDITRDDSLAAFANAEQLATFFRAVRLLSDSQAEARWSWLSKHSVVVVGSMDVTITDRLYAPYSQKLQTRTVSADVVRRGIKYGHFLLDTPPPSWLRSPQFTLLYGQDFGDLERSSFLLCLDDAETRWRYFGYAQAKTPILTKDGRKSFAKYLELESPGPIFDQVASIVHAAACFRLASRNTNVGEDERSVSVNILRHLDFAIFNLSDFLNVDNLSVYNPAGLGP